MGTPRIAAAFGASLVPAALAYCHDATFGRVSFLGLALVPWIVVAGIATLDRGGWVLATVAAWPPLALGLGLDLRGGAHWLGLAPTLLWGGALIAGLSLLACRARVAGRFAFELAWLAVVIAPPCARLALDLGAGGSVSPPLLVALARWSPLGWALERCGEARGAGWWPPWGPLAVIAVLGAAHALDARRSRTAQ